MQEIIRIQQLTRVLNSPEFVDGVINLRGKVIPVIALRKRFGLEETANDKQTRIVVVEVKGTILGFIVDCGAFDYLPKQSSYSSLDIVKIREDLVSKTRAAAESRRPRARRIVPPPMSQLPIHSFQLAPTVVALGTSTGGPKALQEILPTFPRICQCRYWWCSTCPWASRDRLRNGWTISAR